MHWHTKKVCRGILTCLDNLMNAKISHPRMLTLPLIMKPSLTNGPPAIRKSTVDVAYAPCRDFKRLEN